MAPFVAEMVLIEASRQTQKYRLLSTQNLPPSLKELYPTALNFKEDHPYLFQATTHILNLMPTAAAIVGYHLTQSCSFQPALATIFTQVPGVGPYAARLLNRVSIPSIANSALYTLFFLPIIAHVIKIRSIQRLALHANHLALLLLHMRVVTINLSETAVFAAIGAASLARNALCDLRHPGDLAEWTCTAAMITQTQPPADSNALTAHVQHIENMRTTIATSSMNTFERNSLSQLLKFKQWQVLTHLIDRSDHQVLLREEFQSLYPTFNSDSSYPCNLWSLIIHGFSALTSVEEALSYHKRYCDRFKEWETDKKCFFSYYFKQKFIALFPTDFNLVLTEPLEKTLRKVYGKGKLLETLASHPPFDGTAPLDKLPIFLLEYNLKWYVDNRSTMSPENCLLAEAYIANQTLNDGLVQDDYASSCPTLSSFDISTCQSESLKNVLYTLFPNKKPPNNNDVTLAETEKKQLGEEKELWEKRPNFCQPLYHEELIRCFPPPTTS